jgi:hypothetical protein
VLVPISAGHHSDGVGHIHQGHIGQMPQLTNHLVGLQGHLWVCRCTYMQPSMTEQSRIHTGILKGQVSIHGATHHTSLLIMSHGGSFRTTPAGKELSTRSSKHAEHFPAHLHVCQ